MYTTPLSTLISSCSLNHQLYVDDTQLFVSFLPTNFDSSIDHLQNALNRISSCMTANLLTLNSCKTEFLLICLSKQLAKIHNSSLNTSHPTGNVGFIFDEHFTFSGQILSVPKFCYYHIRQLRCIRPHLDTQTASTIVTSTVHSKLDYCNSLYHNLPTSQITQLQQIQNSLARAVVKATKSSHITPILRSLHWLTITERIEYTSSSQVTYEVLTTTKPSYLHNLITVQSPRSTRSLSLVTLARPSTSSSLRITDRAFQYASRLLWNQLPASCRQPRTNLSNSASPSFLVALPPSVPSTHHSHYPSPLHSFISCLKPSFSANPLRSSLPFRLLD